MFCLNSTIGLQSASVVAIRNAGLSVITASKMFWEQANKTFESIGDAEKSSDEIFESIVGKLNSEIKLS